MAAKVTFDVANKIIQIDVAPTLDAGEYVVDIDVKIDIYSDGKEDWITGAPYTLFEFPVSPVGGNPLPGSKALGATFFLASDWKIRPYEASHTFRVNGNLYSEDGTSPFTTTLGTYNVLLTQSVSSLVDSTIQQLPEIQHSAFENAVHIDTSSATTGVDYPAGTPIDPVNNLTDALSIAEYRGFSNLYIMGNITLIATDNIDGHTLEGTSTTKTTITMLSGLSTEGSEFRGAALDGYLDGSVDIYDCHILTISGMSGNIHNTLIEYGIQVMTGQGIQDLHLLNCASGVPDGLPPYIDLGGMGCPALIVRGYYGGLSIKNIADARPMSFDFDAGILILEDTVTSGTLKVRGVMTLIDNSTGTATVDDHAVVNPHSVSKHIWATAGTHAPGTLGHILAKEMGTCQTCTLTTTVFTTDRTEPNGFWTDKLFVQFTGNVTAALAGKTSKLSAYITTNGQFTVEDALPVAPANGDTFYIINE